MPLAASATNPPSRATAEATRMVLEVRQLVPQACLSPRSAPLRARPRPANTMAAPPLVTCRPWPTR
eukprot:15448846-Alexandrium_andersonii.AAC.1